MDKVWITLITVFGGIIASLVSYLIWKKKKIKKQELERAKLELEKQKELEALKKRDRELKELCNYIAGSVDVLIQDTIKVTPEIRKNFKEFSKRYHSLDLVPLPKEEK